MKLTPFNQQVKFTLLSYCLIHILACSTKTENKKESLLTLLGPKETNISFQNTVIENEYYNHILYDGIFQGAGVAILDVNNDGLQDLFLCGNMVSDRLYLNEGNMKFRDITESSGIKNDTWSTVVSVIDINKDGLMDIYVGKYMLTDPEKRKNVLYINQGDLTFVDQAESYGIANPGYCTVANFFDYDRDGDMDLYLGFTPFVNKHEKVASQDHIVKSDYTDRLYKNNGNGTFSDVTFQAGVSNYNYTLSATTGDFNSDGWPDFYVTSDYEEPDYLWINNQNGTFSNKINTALKHISNFSMGSDVADINNDQLEDIIVVDMAPEDHYRSKVNMGGMNPEKFYGLAGMGYHYQYMVNTLQLNNGNGTFSDIAQMAGVSQTDWSWASVFADIDGDGWKDLLITNGLEKDIRNRDYINSRKALMDSLIAVAKSKNVTPSINSMQLIGLAPEEKLSNYAYKNNKDLTFTNLSESWGFDKKTWSSGMAIGDLDNDGDLDVVVNEMNDFLSIYKNNASLNPDFHYLRLHITDQKQLALGTKVNLYTPEGIQTSDVKTTKGYFSSSEPIVNFGLQNQTVIDSIQILWNSGGVTTILNPKVDQLLQVEKSKAEIKSDIAKTDSILFALVKDNANIDFRHLENQYDDFKEEILLPHRMSRLGPAMAIGDINQDGLDDVYIGGASGQAGTLYIQNAKSNFYKSSSQPWSQDMMSEDVEALFFDADGDKDLDLYVASGSNESKEGSALLQDRIYINTNGQFAKASILPPMPISTGSITSVDIDKDGDLDLFIGGRQVPGKYGKAPRSFLLINEGGKFLDKSTQYFKDQRLGMVTSSTWADIDGNGFQDLIVVGEWMPISVYLNDGKQLKKEDFADLKFTSGWWNTIVKRDIDGDGDDDFVLGNLGLNIKYKASKDNPFRAYIDDFDGNGTNDIYLSQHSGDNKYYPVRGRECSSQQMPGIAASFPTFDLFAHATTEEILGDKITPENTLSAYEFRSIILTNDGNGRFSIVPLPNSAQISTVNSILFDDMNKDDLIDLLLFGNNYQREVETVRSDAGIGLILINQKNNTFIEPRSFKSNLLADKDVRKVGFLNSNIKNGLLLIAPNADNLTMYSKN